MPKTFKARVPNKRETEQRNCNGQKSSNDRQASKARRQEGKDAGKEARSRTTTDRQPDKGTKKTSKDAGKDTGNGSRKDAGTVDINHLRANGRGARCVI